jgi:hypothetical protein
MKNFWKVGVLALAMAFTFSACGDDTKETPAPTNTTDEVVGSYTGKNTILIKTSALTGGLIPDETEVDSSVSVVVTKTNTGFELTVDDNDATTAPDPQKFNVNEVSLASNGTSFQIPSQTFTPEPGLSLTVVGIKSYMNGTTPVAGLYTRATKTMKMKVGATIPAELPNGSTLNVPAEIEFEVVKK